MDTASVIIPAYNAEAFLAEAVDSVLAQTYPAVECLVVDDGSSDGTAEVVQRYGNRVRCVRQDNAGPSAARNRGIEEAAGRFVAFLDADDVYVPEKIARQVALLERCPEADVAFCDFILADGDGAPQGRFFERHPIVYLIPSRPLEGGYLFEGDVLSYLLQDTFLHAGSLLLRREALERVGGYDSALTWFEDWQFYYRLAYACRFAFVDEPLFKCRVGRPGSLTSRLPEMMRTGVAMFAGLPDILPGASRELRRAIRERRRRFALENGLRLFYQGEHTPTARWLLRRAAALRLDPRTAYYLAVAHLPAWVRTMGQRLKRRASG